MKKIAWIVSLAMIIAGLGIGAADAQQTEPKGTVQGPPAPPNQNETQTDRVDERKAEAKEWIAAGERVAKKSGIPEAIDAIAFAADHSCLGSPIKKGAMLMEEARKADKERWFMLLPLLAGDEKYGEPNASSVQDPTTGVFNTDAKILILKHRKTLSPVFQGIMMIREAHCAFDYCAKPYDSNDPREFCRAVVRSQTVQNAVMEKMGGKAYLAAVQAQMNVNAEALKGVADPKATFSFASRSEYNPLLDEAFGEAASRHEEDLRQSQAWVDGVFRSIDENKVLTEDARTDRKAMFIFVMLKEKGMFPDHKTQ